jgi:TRAP-type C4-dicarboxylate transport system permease small subunit
MDDALAAIEKMLAVAVFAALALLTVFNIVSRNLFGVSYQKIPEVTPELVLWLSLLGATLALRDGRHIKLELLRYTAERFRGRARRLGSFFALLIMLLLLAASLEFVRNELDLFGAGGVRAVVYPLFFALVAFRYALRCWEANPDAPQADSRDRKTQRGGREVA